MAERRYFGFVIGGSLPAALAANWLAGFGTKTLASSPNGTVLEEVSLSWLLDVVQLPESGGAFGTGATLANFTDCGSRQARCIGSVSAGTPGGSIRRRNKCGLIDNSVPPYALLVVGA
jgi:hypothetical protein